MQRWICRDCGHTLSSTSGTPLAGLHEPSKLVHVVSDMLSAEPSSCRRLGSALALSKMTIWAWRQKVSRAFATKERCTIKNSEPGSIDGLVKSAVTVLRKSRKASREWVDYQRDPVRFPKPDRMRWIDYRLHRVPLPQPMTPHLVQIIFGSGAACRSECERLLVQAGTPGRSAMIVDLGPKSASHRCADQAQPHRFQAGQADLMLDGSEVRATCRDIGLLGSSNLVGRFRAFLQAFSGPATKYLGGYLAWFGARLAACDHRRRQQVLLQAVTVLATRPPTRFWDMTGRASADRHQPCGSA